MAQTLSPSSLPVTTGPAKTGSSGSAGNPSPEMARIKYGAAIIGGAFVLLGVIFGVAVSKYTTASDVAAAVGAVATVVGTIVGAFFGVQAGSSGKEAAEAGRAGAERKLEAALGKLNPQDAQDVLKML